jgi:CheY-like chemotaxis protein
MPTILMVDDDAAQLRLLRLLLKHTPYTLLTAQSAAEALSIVHEQLPDLVLLDIAMPNVNGLQLLHVLRTDPQFAPLKVILMTAGSRRIPPKDVASVYQVLTKPCLIERLEEAIRSALRAEV